MSQLYEKTKRCLQIWIEYTVNMKKYIAVEWQIPKEIPSYTLSIILSDIKCAYLYNVFKKLFCKVTGN